jgi:uracil-DNA glycosylase family 4
MIRGPIPHSCQRCPFAKDGDQPGSPVLGVGPKKPKFVIIGEGPGAEEVRRGMPFVGASGQALNLALSRCGVSRDDVYVTNTTLCKPTNMRTKDEDVIKASEICKNRLHDELNVLDGSPPVLLVGKHAAQRFVGDKFKITELAGSYHEFTIDDHTYKSIPTVHPAAFLRGGTQSDSGGAHAGDLAFWSLLYDVAKVKALSEGKKVIDPSIIVEWESEARTEELVRKFVSDAVTNGHFATDTETVGVPLINGECEKGCKSCHGHSALEPLMAQLVVIGLATEDYAISILWKLCNKATKELLVSLYTNTALTCIMHNSLYDVPVLKQHGMVVGNHIEDTLYMDHNAFPGLPHGLQRVANRFMILRGWKAEFKKGTKDKVQDLLVYNAQDTLNTARLPKPLKAIIQRNNAEQTYELDLKKAQIAIKMQEWGIPIDVERNEVFKKYFEPRIEEAENKLKGMIVDGAFKEKFMDTLAVEKAKRRRKLDPMDFILRHAIRKEEIEEDWEELNLNSRDEIVALLKACGVPLSVTTDKGNLSTGKNVLEQLVKHAAVKLLLRFRELDKLYGTFVEPIQRMMYVDGRVHPTWKPLAISGRWRSSPNWQNHSKGEGSKITFEEWLDNQSLIPNLRWQVRAKPGRVLVGADFNALEARINALMSGDPWLVNAFNNAIDTHTYFARILFPHFDSIGGKKSSEGSMLRDIVKSVFYAFVYGSSELTVFKYLIQEGKNVSMKQVRDMFTVFKKTMPGIVQFHNELIRSVQKNGYVSSFLLGRKRHFPLPNIYNDTVVKNFVCQASAADIADTGLVKLYNQLPQFNNAMILIHGHDSIVVEVDEYERDKMMAVLQESLECEHEHNGVTMKFTAEPSYGDWSQA